MMEKIVEIIFLTLLSIIGTFTLIVFNQIKVSIEQLKKSVEKLNINFATEIEKINNVKETIEKHEIKFEKLTERLTELEKKSFNCTIKGV